MTLPLTKAREEAIREDAVHGRYISLARDDVPVLLGEIDRLRALPVLQTCGGCVHLYCRGRSCEHPAAVTPGEARRVDLSLAPPSWCPLRGGAR